jgi:hypothetical protein
LTLARWRSGIGHRPQALDHVVTKRRWIEHLGFGTVAEHERTKRVGVGRRKRQHDPAVIPHAFARDAGDVPLGEQRGLGRERNVGDGQTGGVPRRRLHVFDRDEPLGRIDPGARLREVGRHARQTEGPDRVAFPVVSHEVPPSRTEHDAECVDGPIRRRALCRAVAEAHGVPVTRGAGGGHQSILVRVRLHRQRTARGTGEDAAVDPVDQLANAGDGIRRRRSALCGQIEGRDLLGREGDVGQVVAVFADRIALLDIPDVGARHLQRHAIRAKHVLVALELALDRVEVVALVGLEGLSDLLERERCRCLEQQSHEVQQALERLHRVLVRHRAR